MEGCKIVLLPWISGALYAGPHLRTYGVESDGQEVIDIVNEVLNMRAYDKEHNETILGHFFIEVSVIAISYGRPEGLEPELLEPPKKKSKSAPVPPVSAARLEPRQS
jgi:hypothetical protein